MAIIWNNSSMSQITGHQNELVTTSCHFLSPPSLPSVTILVFQISILGKYRSTRFTRLFALGENKKGTCPRLQIKFNISVLSSPSTLPPPLPCKCPLTHLLCLTFHCWAKLDFVHLFLWMEICDKKRLFPFNRRVLLKFPRLAKVNPQTLFYFATRFLYAFFQLSFWNVSIKIDHVCQKVINYLIVLITKSSIYNVKSFKTIWVVKLLNFTFGRSWCF